MSGAGLTWTSKMVKIVHILETIFYGIFKFQSAAIVKDGLVEISNSSNLWSVDLFSILNLLYGTFWP
jgi:hypothetical protein